MQLPPIYLASALMDKLLKIQQTRKQEIVINQKIRTGIVHNRGILEQFSNRPPIVKLKNQTKETNDNKNYLSKSRTTNIPSALKQIGIIN